MSKLKKQFFVVKKALTAPARKFMQVPPPGFCYRHAAKYRQSGGMRAVLQ